jgi:hypothetical protein
MLEGQNPLANRAFHDSYMDWMTSILLNMYGSAYANEVLYFILLFNESY